jgi:hypothetical protein
MMQHTAMSIPYSTALIEYTARNDRRDVVFLSVTLSCLLGGIATLLTRPFFRAFVWNHHGGTCNYSSASGLNKLKR